MDVKMYPKITLRMLFHAIDHMWKCSVVLSQAAKEELETRQQELHDMMQRLEESKNMEAEERARLEEQIRAKQDEVSTIYKQVYLTFVICHAPESTHDHIKHRFLMPCLIFLLCYKTIGQDKGGWKHGFTVRNGISSYETWGKIDVFYFWKKMSYLFSESVRC